VTFGNLAGAWALAGLLAVLAIHFLQRRTRRVAATTLFLLDPLRPRIHEGTRFERLRSSASLWLQMAAVLVLAWLLLAPRFLLAESVQRIVVVLDASVSISAFREPLRAALERRTTALAGGAARTEWVLLDTALGHRTLFTGADRTGLVRALDAWEPRLGTHDASPSLEVARTLAGPQGLVVFATDHVAPPPEGIELLAVGSPTENVGFVGVEVETGEGGPSFRALVKNHGAREATRTCRAEAEGWQGPASSLRLPPGAVRVVSGPFPPGREAFVLVLEADRFTLDDRLPLVRPRSKPLRVHVTPAAQAIAFTDRFLGTLEEVVRVGAAARPDLAIVTAGEAPPFVTPPARVVLGAGPGGTGAYLRGPIVAANHPLVADLNWQGLLVRADPRAAPVDPDATTLVAQGSRPLVLWRGPAAAAQLVVAFSVPDSNADRLPALPLLLHRFAESVRAATVGHERANVETGQRLSVAGDPGGASLRRELEAGTGSGDSAATEDAQQAPARPGFFRILQGQEPRLTAAAHFADAREADLLGAASREETRRHDRLTVARNSREDPLAPLWVVLLAGLLLADWRLQARAGAAA
jgi:hypothetical protein